MDSTWLQDLLRTSGDVYSQVRIADALRQQQISGNGMAYTNGAFGTPGAPLANGSLILLLGGAALLILFLKD
ncbi:hypothetical protein MCERHM31_00800 [Methylophilaceae bacterium]